MHTDIELDNTHFKLYFCLLHLQNIVRDTYNERVMTVMNNRFLGRKSLESQTTLTPLTACGNIQQNASHCGKRCATSLPQPSVESPVPPAGVATLPVLPSTTSGISHQASELWKLNVLSSRNFSKLLLEHVWSLVVNQLAPVLMHLKNRTLCIIIIWKTKTGRYEGHSLKQHVIFTIFAFDIYAGTCTILLALLMYL